MDEKNFGPVIRRVGNSSGGETVPTQSSGTKSGAKRKRSRIVNNDSSDSDN